MKLRRWPLLLMLLPLVAVASGLAGAVVAHPNAAAVVALNLLDGPFGSSSEEVSLVVAPGATAADIGRQLEEKGVIRSSFLFRTFADLRGLATRLEAGAYKLRKGRASNEVIDLLVNGGHDPDATFTLVEGWRAEEVALELERRGKASAVDFMAEVARSENAWDLGIELPPGATLEGYLFPDTYQLEFHQNPGELVTMMLQQFKRKLPRDAKERAAARGMTLPQVVALASIIEREAILDVERPLISSVYYNRLAIGMPLQADPTLQYALAPAPLSSGDGLSMWKPRLLAEDLRIDSPYNTYQHVGLPPGPIANPGLASILAALEPAPSPYLYFVATGDGSHAFATTEEDHRANVARYRSR